MGWRGRWTYLPELEGDCSWDGHLVVYALQNASLVCADANA